MYNSQCGCPFSREKYEVYPGQCFFFCTAHARGHIWHWVRNEISRMHNRYQATLKISNQRYCTKRNIEIMLLLFSWDKDIERKSVPDVRFLVDIFSFVLFFVFVTWQIFGSDQYFFLYLPTLIIIINYIRTTDEVHKNS